jgi:outer membrane protein assembly factor BamB
VRRRAARRVRRLAASGILGRISLGTAAQSPRLRRLALAIALLGVALVPYPSLSAPGAPPAPACRAGCRGAVPRMVAWTAPLPGSWDVAPGLTGTTPASGLAYAAIGHGVAAVGVGLRLYGYSATTGARLWGTTLTGFPAGAAIVSVRAWPGEVTAGVSYPVRGGRVARTEVVLSGATGIQSGRYPAAPFGGAVAGSPAYTVIVGPGAVTSYDNATGRVRWRRPTGQLAQAWQSDGSSLYVAESAGGLAGSAPVTAVRKISLATGAEVVIRPLDGLSFRGRLSGAFDGVVLFSSARGVTAYSAADGAWLWSMPGAVAEGTDPQQRRIYLTRGSSLVAVSPQTGRVTATASGSAVAGSAGVYLVRDGVALGLDQGAGGDAWGYDIGAQRVTLAAAGLPWPHYFVDLSGVGGSADPAGPMVIIAACAALAPGSPAQPSPPATASASQPASPGTSSAPAAPRATPAAGAAGSPSPSASPPPAGQACLRPELVALDL